MILHVLKDMEQITTLAEDLELLASDELDDWKMRFALIYRSERKKICHSQLNLVDWLTEILSVCEHIPSREELASKFKEATFKKTVFEEGDLLHTDEKEQYRREEDYFLRRIYAADYLKELYEFVEKSFWSQKYWTTHSINS